MRASVRAQFKLIKSTPVSLSGTVGERGNNKIHDVAMVQALLSIKKDKRARVYFKDKVNCQAKSGIKLIPAAIHQRVNRRRAKISLSLNAGSGGCGSLSDGSIYTAASRASIMPGHFQYANNAEELRPKIGARRAKQSN